MELVVLVVAGLVIPETFTVMLVLAGRVVVEMFETVMLCPDALQLITVERELLTERATLALQVPLEMVMLVGRVITTTAPTPRGFFVCITKE